MRPVKDLIKNAMTLETIEIKGTKEHYSSQILDQCMSKSEKQKGELEEQLKDKQRDLSNLRIEIIVDCQKLIVLKKDLGEESG